jgi:hypothetical protein
MVDKRTFRTPPNKGMELTAYSVGSYLAPAFSSSSSPALDLMVAGHTRAKKIVLHCPRGCQPTLDPLVEEWIRDGVVFVGAVGKTAPRSSRSSMKSALVMDRA